MNPDLIMQTAKKIWDFCNKTEVQVFIRQIKEKVKEINTLSYDVLMDMVVKDKPDDERVVAAALLREKKGDITKISIIYLNRKNEPIFGDGNGKEYGFSMQSALINPDVDDLFGDKDLVLLT